MNYPSTLRAEMRPHRGVALVIVMIFIVILSGVAAFAARKALFGEGLARNQLDAEVATQAAESALRDAEFDLQIKTNSGTLTGATCSRGNARPLKADQLGIAYFKDNCLLGQCRPDAAANLAEYAARSNAATLTNPQAWWPSSAKWNNTFTDKPPDSTACNFTGGVPLGTFTGAPAIRGVSRQPEYLIENVTHSPEGETVLRITSRGWGLSPNSEVVMQSFFSLGRL